jgi:predicted dehydrogenase
MGEAARRSPALLSVGMVRRLSRSARLLRSTVERGILGELVGATVEEGGEFNWPLRTAHVFEGTKEGGALRDTGTHLIDLLLWVLGARGARLVEYRDDSWGGPEANALVELEVDVASGRIPARVEVSFTRKLENSLRIEGEHGTLEGRSVGGAEALFRPATGPEREVLLRAGDGKARTRVEDFALQLEAFARAVRTGGPPPVSPAEALPTASLIEECYLGRRPRVQPWETLPDGVSGSAGWGA